MCSRENIKGIARQSCNSWIQSSRQKSEIKLCYPGKICDGLSCLMAWTPVNCMGDTQVFEKMYINKNTASLDGRETEPEWKEGRLLDFWDSTGRKQAGRSIQFQACVILQGKWRTILKVIQRPVAATDTTSPEGISPGRWAISSLIPERSLFLSFRGWTISLVLEGRAPAAQGWGPRGPTTEPKKIIFKFKILTEIILIGFRFAWDPWPFPLLSVSLLEWKYLSCACPTSCFCLVS